MGFSTTSRGLKHTIIIDPQLETAKGNTAINNTWPQIAAAAAQQGSEIVAVTFSASTGATHESIIDYLIRCGYDSKQFTKSTLPQIISAWNGLNDGSKKIVEDSGLYSSRCNI